MRACDVPALQTVIPLQIHHNQRIPTDSAKPPLQKKRTITLMLVYLLNKMKKCATKKEKKKKYNKDTMWDTMWDVPHSLCTPYIHTFLGCFFMGWSEEGRRRRQV
jgi:hypothetical protein